MGNYKDGHGWNNLIKGGGGGGGGCGWGEKDGGRG